jgi:acylphosphatase
VSCRRGCEIHLDGTASVNGSMVICKRVYYSGTVQGVGFRYAAQGLASGFAVAGYVRNLSDGQVELVAEGEADQVHGFLKAVARRMGGYIEGTTVSDETPEGTTGFRIRH